MIPDEKFPSWKERLKPRWQLGAPVWVFVSVAILALLFFLSVDFNQVRGPTPRSQCKNNLKQIGLALHNYHDTYGCFPPAYFVGKDGRPMHSWRVMILPQLEETNLYKEYRFDEPWNGPHNSALAKRMPREFRCPGNKSASDTETSYAAIVGEKTAWPGDKCLTFGDLSDGASITLGVVEAAGSGINWMEPRDLDYAKMQMTINPKSGSGIASPHVGGANALLMDGSVRFISEKLPAETLRRLIERNDGKPVESF